MVEFMPDPAFGPLIGGGSPPTDSSLLSLFTALEEQLGLKLESTRGPVEVVVVEKFERPTPD